MGWATMANSASYCAGTDYRSTRALRCRSNISLSTGTSTVRRLLAATALFATLAPALALDEPVVWRDPDSGCAYWLTPQGGIAPQFDAMGYLTAQALTPGQLDRR